MGQFGQGEQRQIRKGTSGGKAGQEVAAARRRSGAAGGRFSPG